MTESQGKTRLVAQNKDIFTPEARHLSLSESGTVEESLALGRRLNEKYPTIKGRTFVESVDNPATTSRLICDQCRKRDTLPLLNILD